MKARFVVLFLIFSAAHHFTVCVNAITTEVNSVHRESDGVTLNLKSGMLRLQVFSERVVRVLYFTQDELPQTKSFSVVAQPARTTWKLVETPAEVQLQTQALEVHVNRTNGAVSFYDRTGSVLLVEGQRSLTPEQIGDLKSSKSRQEFVLPDDEAVYGLGQHQAGVMNYRNTIVHLQQENMKVAIPFLVSSKGYGLLWDNPSITDVSVAAGYKQAIPSVQLYDDADAAGGLTAHYYRGINFEELVRTQIDPAIDFDWGNTPPVSIPATERRKKYSVRWTGSIEARQEGDYTFFVAGGNGVRLWVDDKLLVDDWNSFSVDTNAARVHFFANSRHKIRVDYYHERWEGKVKLEWSEPVSKPVVSWSSEAADAIDYYFMYGPALDQVIGSYRRLTGNAPMFGRWAWGFWQCKERYKSQQELVDVVGEYRKRNIPIDGIIQDWR
ncbi:MAG TPA: PA14 domain-containing protein, partial [Pyrinomonadaceae bacterium]